MTFNRYERCNEDIPLRASISDYMAYSQLFSGSWDRSKTDPVRTVDDAVRR